MEAPKEKQPRRKRFPDGQTALDLNVEETPPPEKEFIVPSIEEVAAFIKEKGYKVDAELFWHFYESKGWMVGRNKMKNWKSAVVTWTINRRRKSNNATANDNIPSGQRSEQGNLFELKPFEQLTRDERNEAFSRRVIEKLSNDRAADPDLSGYI